MANVFNFLHQRFAIALILFAVILGLWGGFQFLTRRQVSGGFRSGYLLMIALTAAQGLAGILIFALGLRPRELLHIVYGIFAIAFLPGVYFYAARGTKLREAFLMPFGCWIVAIAYGRGFLTGA
ncbi:MAG: hypothetical protein ACR2MZ_11570 [Candidatus Dormibacter sp.]|uniref:hypothetical protein n=1 Tax=Candidatus Dormibacter sp. TaxID=2973982 RepID=UPI00268C74FC